MHYIQCRKLNKRKRQQIIELEDKCFPDGERPWSKGEGKDNYKNLYTTADCFFLCYQKEQLVGFLGLFIPEEDAELTAFVEPSFQRKGIFTELLKRATAVMKRYRLQSLFCYPKSQGVLVDNTRETQPALWKTGWARESVELMMERSAVSNQDQKADISTENHAKLRLLTKQTEDISQIAAMEADLFGGEEVGEEAFQSAMAEENTECFAFYCNEDLLGACCIKSGKQKDFIFGVVIKKSEQGKGYGQKMLQLLFQNKKTCKHSLCLQVSYHNVSAVALYHKLGFVITQQQEVYRRLIS